MLDTPCFEHAEPGFGEFAEIEGAEDMRRIPRARIERVGNNRDLFTNLITLLSLAADYLTNNNDDESDKEHSATDDVCLGRDSTSR